MKKISTWISTAIDWLFVSSANPGQAATTVKASLLFLVPMALNALTVSCGVGFVCVTGVDAMWFNELINWIANIVEWVLNIVATCLVIYGLFRKIGRTAEGKNVAMIASATNPKN